MIKCEIPSIFPDPEDERQDGAREAQMARILGLKRVKGRNNTDSYFPPTNELVEFKTTTKNGFGLGRTGKVTIKRYRESWFVIAKGPQRKGKFYPNQWWVVPPGGLDFKLVPLLEELQAVEAMTPRILFACIDHLRLPPHKVAMAKRALKNGKVKNNPKVTFEELESHGYFSLPPDNPRENFWNIALGWKGERQKRLEKRPSIFDQPHP